MVAFDGVVWVLLFLFTLVRPGLLVHIGELIHGFFYGLVCGSFVWVGMRCGNRVPLKLKLYHTESTE